MTRNIFPALKKLKNSQIHLLLVSSKPSLQSWPPRGHCNKEVAPSWNHALQSTGPLTALSTRMPPHSVLSLPLINSFLRGAFEWISPGKCNYGLCREWTGDRGPGGGGAISISHIEMTFKTRPAIVCSRFGTKGAVVVSPCEGIVTNFESASASV